MKFSDYMDKILATTPEQWNVVSCWGGHSGPSYRTKFEVPTSWQGSSEQNWQLAVESHSMVAALRDDLSITIAWGLAANNDFREPWANSFADSHASSSYVDFFFNGALVFRDLYVTVDGGRVKLPLPEERTGKLSAPRRYADMCRLLISFESKFAQLFDDAIARAAIELTEDPWPR